MTEAKYQNDVEAIDKLTEIFNIIKSELAKVIIGQDEIIEQLLISLFSRGHCLLIGVPGLAKTLMIKTFGGSLISNFREYNLHRISCHLILPVQRLLRKI